MAILGVSLKDPDDTLDYDVDYTHYLPAGDSLTGASANAEAGISVDKVEIDGNVAKVWVSGGTDGNTYAITVTGTSAGGRVKDATFKLRVRPS